MKNLFLIFILSFPLMLFAESEWFTLNGKWDFYADRLIELQELEKAIPDGTLLIPGSWEKVKFQNQHLLWKGMLTLHRKIVVPYSKGTVCGMTISQIGTAYRLYLNGTLIASNGVPSVHTSDYRPALFPVTVFFSSPSTQWDILIQTENLVDRMGSLIKPIEVGPARFILHRQQKKVMAISLIIGVLLIMMVYHLSLFVLNRQDFSNLWYAILILLAIIRVSLEGQKPFFLIFPNFPFDISLRLVYLSYYFGVFVFLHFIHGIFSSEFPLRLTRVVEGLLLAFNVIALFLPLRWLTSSQIVFHILTLFSIGLVLFGLTRAVLRKRFFSVYYLVGVIFLVASGLNDILYSQGVIQTGYRLHWGIFFFIVVQAIALSARFAKIEALPDDQKVGEKESSLFQIAQPFGETLELSKREKEVLSELSSGKSYQEIADTLFISSRTVKYHVYHIYQKTGVGTRAELFNKMMQYSG